MTLEEYIKGLNEIVAENPEYAKLDVIYSRDSEGNGYEKIYYTATAGNFDDGEFTSDVEEDQLDINSICVN